MSCFYDICNNKKKKNMKTQICVHERIKFFDKKVKRLEKEINNEKSLNKLVNEKYNDLKKEIDFINKMNEIEKKKMNKIHQKYMELKLEILKLSKKNNKDNGECKENIEDEFVKIKNNF